MVDPPHRSFQDRRVWLTGATSGIGRALAVELAGRGARVAASGRDRAALASLQAELGAERLLPVPLDVTDRAANHAAVATIREAWGGLDLAVLNAGICEYVDARHFDAALFERAFQVNVLGMVYGIEAALPLLRESPRPHLAGMSSTVAYGALPRAEAYGATKAAGKYLLESLRLSLRAEGIAVSVICPGFVRTPLTDQNDFPMPARIEADDAARRIADGLARQRMEIHFPKRFSLTFKLISALPHGLYVRLIGGLVKRP